MKKSRCWQHIIIQASPQALRLLVIGFYRLAEWPSGLFPTACRGSALAATRADGLRYVSPNQLVRLHHAVS